MLPGAATSPDYAIRAWTRRHSGGWTEADEVELQTWLAAAPESRAAYERVAGLWADIGQVGPNLKRTARPVRRARRYILAGACAAALGAAIFVPLWRAGYHWWNGSPVQWITRRGEPKTFALQDGTRVLLDADSHLVATIGARARRITLVRGEATFNVMHDASRPFEVKTGLGRITDVGTRFDVENLQGSVRISVVEGRVGVSTPHGKVLLDGGRGGGYDANGFLFPVRTVDSDVVLWSEGQRHFDAEPMADVVERLTRYHAVTFVFTEPRLKQLRVSGTFRIGDLPLFLRTLGTALPIETRWLSPQRVEIRPRPVPVTQDSRKRLASLDRH